MYAPWIILPLCVLLRPFSLTTPDNAIYGSVTYRVPIQYQSFRMTQALRLGKPKIGSTLGYVAPFPFWLMFWHIKAPMHQQAWYSPSKAKYSIHSIRKEICVGNHNE